jgi:hypothetical protein
MSTRVISNAARSHEEELRDRLRLAVRRDGGDPSSFLELLSDAVAERIWEKLGTTRSFREFVEAPIPDGLGLDEATLSRLIAFSHHHEDKDPGLRESLAGMRRFVRSELNPKAPEHVGRGHSSDNIKPNSGGDSETYWLRRLKRDAPELAERVLDGELSANAAAIKAGLKPRKISVRIDDVSLLAGTLRRRLTADQLTELRGLL